MLQVGATGREKEEEHQTRDNIMFVGYLMTSVFPMV
jgi:hypothetical protein